MSLSPLYFTPRITDYSYRACSDIDRLMISKEISISDDLRRLYAYQKTQWTLYPMTNWQSHRLMLQACIAFKLLDKALCQEVHAALLRWLRDSNCADRCGANSQDHHWRDSIEYLIYGLQAYVKAGLYLKPVTRYDYKKDIAGIMKWLDPYLKGTKTHIEYKNSMIPSDVNKPSYGKQFNPAYANTMLRWHATL